MNMRIDEATSRVIKLREKVFEFPMHKDKLHYGLIRRPLLLFTRGWEKYSNVYTTRLRRAYSEAYVLENMRPVIDDDELIVGSPDLFELTEDEQRELDDRVSRMKYASVVNGRRGHMTLDWSKLLRVGVIGLIKEINNYKENLDMNLPENISKYEFYEGCIVELNALLTLAKKYVEHARELAKKADPKRAKELLEIADILERVPANPARTFREALQSIHFYCFCLWDMYFYGRLDQYLISFYQEDIKQNRLTPEEAQELMDCFMIMVSRYMHAKKGFSTGLQAVSIGGRDTDGNVVENEVTWLILNTISHVPLATSQIQLLYNKDISDDLLNYAIDLISKGYSQPQIYNDDLIINSMLKAGFPSAEARHYSSCGCVEIVPCACSGMWPVSPYHNILKMLLNVMREKRGYKCLDDLIKRFSEVVRDEVIKGNLQQNRWQLERQRNGCESLRASCLVNDCLVNGKSIDEGGARYNHIQPNFVGLSNVVDSLAAIDILVFEDKTYTMDELCAILDSNYEGNEALRNRIIYKFPHFGTNEEKTDELAKRIANILIESCKNIYGYRGDTLLPGAFSFQEHVRFGLETGASPDGRLRGYPLAAGSSPVQGRETEGPTAAILSATKWNQSAFLGGVANNIMFSKKNMTGEGKQKIISLIKTLFEQGGFEVQVNVTDRKVLEDAVKNPERHRNLLVRVGGFNAYFVDCEPGLQQEIMDRNEHAL